MYSVYKHTCPDGKVYIGITNQEPEKRWLNGFGYQRQHRFFSAIVKFGWDNILHEVIAQVESQQEANRIEQILIFSHKAKLPEFGYNTQGGYRPQNYLHSHIPTETSTESHPYPSTDISAQKPLDGRGKTSKKVAQYSKDGKLIATFNSLRDASQFTGINHGDICSCCKGHKADGTPKRSAGGFIWKYVNTEKEVG